MRLLLTIFILLVAATFQTVTADKLAWMHLSVDFLLVSVICCALQLNGLSVLGVAVFAGLLRDSFSASVFGYSVAIFVPIGLAVCKLREFLWVGHWTTQAGLAFACTVVGWVLYSVLLKMGGLPLESGIDYVLKSALLNACVTPPMFKLWRAVLQ